MKTKIYSALALVVTAGLVSFGLPKDELTNVTKKQDVAKGKAVYNKLCIACHQANGQGIPNAFPPLANSDYLNKDTNRTIKTVLNGLKGPIVVNGKKYNGVMSAQGLNDQQVADVLTYVYSSWGNNKTKVTPAMVKAQRGKK